MNNPRKIIIVGISLFVGLLHFIIGTEYNGPFRSFLLGYLIDILLPFCLYLLLGLVKHPLIKNAYFRGIIIFLIGLGVEVLQYNGFKLFGNTADMLDLVAYVSGILSAVIFEHFVLSKIQTSNK